jgi:transcriptional regulator with XRE-family HTH domain
MSKESVQKIGPFLKMERIKSGTSPSRIARESGLTQSTVSRLENGDSNFYIAAGELCVGAGQEAESE